MRSLTRAQTLLRDLLVKDWCGEKNKDIRLTLYQVVALLVTVKFDVARLTKLLARNADIIKELQNRLRDSEASILEPNPNVYRGTPPEDPGPHS